VKTKDIEFNADDLVGSVEAFAHHLTGNQKLTMRTVTMPLPPRAKPLTQIKGFSQDRVLPDLD